MKHVEDREQRALIEWADYTKVNRMLPLTDLATRRTLQGHSVGRYLVAVPNGGGRSAAEGGILKATGVRAGFPDLMLAIPRRPYAGLFIEMKKPLSGFKTPGAARSAVRASQLEWLQRLRDVGYAADVAYGAESAMNLIRVYLGDMYEALPDGSFLNIATRG